MEQPDLPLPPSAYIRKTFKKIFSKTCLFPFFALHLVKMKKHSAPWLDLQCGSALIHCLGNSWYTRKSRYKVLLLSQKLSCGETAVIMPTDILRRLNYGSWNTFPFQFVFYINGGERCFQKSTWETERLNWINVTQ